MTTYRVFPTGEKPSTTDDVTYLEADSDEEARAKALVEADLTEADLPDYTVAPLPTEMESECVCSEQPVLFKRGATDYPAHPHIWVCQNCHAEFIVPPDEINWENERMFAEGYVPCGCDHYDIRCRCEGAGWYRPGDDDDNGYVARFEDDDDDSHGGNPYYEEDGYYEMDDEEDDDSGDDEEDDPYLDDPYYDPNLELEMGD
ncbi:MAG: hypothetical protein KJ077_05885 [Anaerolineae bacterium]|nr:hypothetical protein [Anaerolineae bacterium]